MKHWKRWATGGLLFLFTGIVFAIIVFSIWNPGRPAGDGNRTVIFEVERGQGLWTVSRNLEAEGLLVSGDFFRTLFRVSGKAHRIQAGLYELNDGMSATEIGQILTEGRVRLQSFTVPEGYHNRQIGDILARHGFVESREQFLELASDPAVLAKFNIPADSSEGYLFPDTYSVPEGYPAEKIQDMMIRRFFDMVEKAAPDHNLSPQELHEKVILASIIEREAAHQEELPVMARVFENRLQQGMRLESCATVQYTFERPKSRLLYRDLEIDSPYNTYRNRGLPPGPISNPGYAAIEGAFHPEDVDYIFFVLRPGERGHHFSSSYSEHLTARQRYLTGNGIPVARTD